MSYMPTRYIHTSLTRSPPAPGEKNRPRCMTPRQSKIFKAADPNPRTRTQRSRDQRKNSLKEPRSKKKNMPADRAGFACVRDFVKKRSRKDFVHVAPTYIRPDRHRPTILSSPAWFTSQSPLPTSYSALCHRRSGGTRTPMLRII